MKKYLLSLICALAASAAWAQSPAPAEAYRPIPIGADAAPTVLVQTPPAEIAAATTVTAITATATTTATAAQPAACDTGCVKLKTVCVAQPATVTKTKVLFSSECSTICLCSLFGKKGDCDSCNGHCGRPKNVKSLYKRVETTTCESTKCVPVQVPCATPDCPTTCASGKCVGSTAVAAGQAAPAAAMSGQVVPDSMRPALGFVEMAR